MKKIRELLEGQGDNYILPFLWMKGESHDDIREEIEKIAVCGIREICLESRPHPDFAGPLWWKDLEFIISEVKKRGMKIWILDDSHFPTGYANGAFQQHQELKKWYLGEHHVDIIGPLNNASVLVEPNIPSDGTIIKILVFPRKNGNSYELISKGVIDVTESYANGFVHFTLPEGRYTLVSLFSTQTGGGRNDYMNLIDSKSVDILINEVYESHYSHYKEEFGKTILGFFSDEPEIGNNEGYHFHELPGILWKRLPWSNELYENLKALWSERTGVNLVSLWFDTGSDTSKVRTEYMDNVSDLVRKCFSEKIGKWCEKHNVFYIGHIIEDDNAHSRLGCSIGHYFKEMQGRHMGGVDVVHYQIMPGFNDEVHQWEKYETDGEFFHFGLAKLGSSISHIDANKKGKSICELYGNYGWAFSVGKMCWIANHLLVRGINHFTPHAFSLKFPDTDCPPHFYAKGNNPQFMYFSKLMKYLNRMSHLISDGQFIAEAAIVYHGKAEWGGKKRMLFQTPGRILMEHQMNYDVIPEDILSRKEIKATNKKLVINGNTYSVIIQPYFEEVPDEFAEMVSDFVEKGIPIIVIDKIPEKMTSGKELPRKYIDSVQVVLLSDLAKYMEQFRILGKVNEYKSNLRTFIYQQQDGQIILIFNEAAYDICKTTLFLSDEVRKILEYDAWNNAIRGWNIENGYLELYLEPGEEKVLYLPNDIESEPENVQYHKQLTKKVENVLKTNWTLSLRNIGEQDFRNILKISIDDSFPDIHRIKGNEDFVGYLRYEADFTNNFDGKFKTIYFPYFDDCLTVILNGQVLPDIIGSPARIDVTNALKIGENHIQIDVASTLVWKLKDPSSTQMQITPSGIMENPRIEIFD